jgi:putative thiamine transport system permease protein
MPRSFTLTTWIRTLANLEMPLRHTLALAVVSSLAATALALGLLECAERHGTAKSGRALQALYVPLIVPQIAFLVGLQIVFSYAGLDGTFVALGIVHLTFVFPYVLLSLAGPWRAFDPRYAHVIRALGRGPDAVFWRVRLPMLFRPVMVAAALGFAVSVAIYLPTLLIGAGRWPTVTTEAVALAAGGDPRLIGSTALLQAALPFLGFAVAAVLPAILFRNRRLMRASA